METKKKLKSSAAYLFNCNNLVSITLPTSIERMSPQHLIGAIVLSAYLSPKEPQTTLCASTLSNKTAIG